METSTESTSLDGSENRLSGDATPTLRNNDSISLYDPSFENFYVQCNITVNYPKADSEPHAKATRFKKSINNFRQPQKDFVTCTTVIDVNEKLKSSQSLVLHLRGFPGTGKSAIVRKLAADFPFNKNEETVFIKYLIECSDSSEDIGESLKKLVKQMWECKLVLDNDACDRACDQLEMKRTVSFVKILEEAAIPVLIVIEDPTDEQLVILTDLLCSFHNKISSQITKSNTIHLCITSQSKNICKLSCDQCCKRVQVNGLTDEEGLVLLGISCEDFQTEREAALKVITDLNGSPLGLIAVRATRRKSRINYEEYCVLRDVSHHKEIELLKEDLGPHTNHIYQAIVTLMDEKGLWDTMKVLSFFHHGAIPQRLIGNVKLRQRAINDQQPNEAFLKNKLESGEFICRLEDFALCEVNGDKYDETTITLHQVVLHSVQTYMKDKIPALRQAIFALASLVQKDIRTQTKYKFVLSMIPHILSVIQFADLHPDVCNDFVTSMAVVHLREVYGNAAKHFDSVAAERSLRKCARTIWNVMSKRCDMQRDLDDLLNETNVPVTETAQTIFEACLAAGEQLKSEKNLLDSYTAVITLLKSGDHDALLNASTNHEMIKRLNLLSKYSLPVTPDELSNFRLLEDRKLFLDIRTHCQVFFIDRLVSILYTLGRVVQYDHHVTKRKLVKFVWISDLAHALCEPCRQRSGVNLLYLRLSAISRVNVRLKYFAKIDSEKKKDVLNDAIKVMENNLINLTEEVLLYEFCLRVSFPFYENGLKSIMEGNAFDEMINLCAMIRIHTKLLGLCSGNEDDKDIKQSADQFCKRLCKQARTNIERWSVSAKCLVYCGKYMASLGNYRKAIEHFLEALSCKAIVDDRFRSYPWVCYNYARATVAGKLQSHKEDAKIKGLEALKYQSDIPGDLAEKLKEQIKLL